MTERHIETVRTGRAFVLGPPGDEVDEVWIVLHGYGQLASHFLRRFRCLEDRRRLIIAPEALSRFYVGGTRGAVGASWMTKVERDAEIADALGYLDRVWEDTAACVPSAESRPATIVLGFSQGAATAARWAVRGGVTVDRLILWGGLLPPDLGTEAERERLDTLEVSIVVGDRDEYLTAERISLERERILNAGIAVDWVEYAGGHEISADVLKDLAGASRLGR